MFLRSIASQFFNYCPNTIDGFAYSRRANFSLWQFLFLVFNVKGFDFLDFQLLLFCVSFTSLYFNIFLLWCLKFKLFRGVFVGEGWFGSFLRVGSSFYWRIDLSSGEYVFFNNAIHRSRTKHHSTLACMWLLLIVTCIHFIVDT